MAKFGFSRKPWLKQQKQRQEIENNRLAFEREQEENKSWTKRKTFKSNKYIGSWSRYKSEKEKILTDLTLNSLSVCDAANEVNEALLRGLGLKDTAIDLDSVEELTYNIYMIKLIEILCSNKGANLNRSTRDKVISAFIAQIIPPSVAQKPTDPRKGDKLIEELSAIRSSLR